MFHIFRLHQGKETHDTKLYYHYTALYIFISKKEKLYSLMYQTYITVSYILETLDEKIQIKFGLNDSTEMWLLLMGNNSAERTFFDEDSTFSFLIKTYCPTF